MTQLTKIQNGAIVPLTGDELAEFQRLEAEHQIKVEQLKVTEYQRLRKYPSIPDQLDILFHEGYEGWKAVIQAVKDANPKPQ